MNKSGFYDILFDRGEGIGYQSDHGTPGLPGFYKKNRVILHNGDQDEYNFAFNFYCINPIHPTIDHDPQESEEYKARIKIANVTSFRNFAIEFDEDSLEDQKKKLQLAKPPVSAVIFSGSKSLHTPIALESGVTQEEYSAIFEAIKQTLLKYDLKLDKQCSNPNRLTRAPFEIRNGKSVEQKLLGSRGRIPNQVLFDWFEANEVNWRDYIYKPKESTYEYEGVGDADDEMRWLAAVGSCRHFNGDYTTSEQWQPWLYELGKWCKAYGLSEDMAIMWANRDYTHPDNKAIDTGIKNGYKYGKLSPRTLNKPKVLPAIVDDIFDTLDVFDTIFNGDVADINLGGVHNYIRVGTKYYRTDGVNVEIWDKQTLKDDFGTRVLASPELRKYRGFINEPNYLERIEHVTKHIDGVPYAFYNKFWYPNWKLAKGEIPTTMDLLKKVFIADQEDHLEIGLDWIQLLLTKPKQRTRSLVLTGPSETGKDTFMEWLVAIVTDRNGIILEGTEIESSFNSHWSGKHLVGLNEVSFDLKNKVVTERLKNLLTAKRVTVEGKGDQQYQIENYSKVVLATNNIHDFMSISDEENRYHIRQMSPLNEKVANYVDMLHAEIPAFINWICNERCLSRTEKHGRFWHSDEECETRAGQALKRNTKTTLHMELEDLLSDKFRIPDLRDFDEYCFRVKTVAQSLRKQLETKGIKSEYSDKAIKMCLLKEFGLNEIKTERKDAFNGFLESNNYHFTVSRQKLGLIYG